MVSLQYILNDIWDIYGDPTMRESFPGGPLNVLVIVTSYLLIVLYIGPRLMKNRKAYGLSSLMKVYNLSNIVFNTIIFVVAMKVSNFGLKCFQCGSVITSDEQLVVGGGYYYLKIFDLLDTLIFILRKKDSQVSRLHVVHHVVIPCLVWLGIKFYPYPIAGMTILVNTFVHILMYT